MKWYEDWSYEVPGKHPGEQFIAIFKMPNSRIESKELIITDRHVFGLVLSALTELTNGGT